MPRPITGMVDEIGNVVTRIERDFQERKPPFDGVTFPEERLLDEVLNDYEPTKEEELVFVSMFATFDYNRDANQLVDNIIELWEERWWVFSPVTAAGAVDELASEFKKIGFRYPNRDAKAWSKNCSIITEKYAGQWTDLLLDTGCDAPTLVERLNEDDFNCVKGVKIAPMYARIINDEIAPMSNLWELDIPVDTWIRKISKELFREDLEDDQIRDRWRIISEENDIERQIVDAALWQIGNNLDEWGKEYLVEVSGTENFKYL